MKETLRILCEVGFSAIRRDLKQNTDGIFLALRVERPNNACGYIGQALILATDGHYERAISILEEASQTCTQAVQEANEICEVLRLLKAEQAA